MVELSDTNWHQHILVDNVDYAQLNELVGMSAGFMLRFGQLATGQISQHIAILTFDGTERDPPVLVNETFVLQGIAQAINNSTLLE